MSLDPQGGEMLQMVDDRMRTDGMSGWGWCTPRVGWLITLLSLQSELIAVS